ncbi:MAG: hypothetical protein ABSG13_23415 [Bryobacteraceae bacterium]|jgi:hypothetical protein
MVAETPIRGEITRILHRWKTGNQEALSSLASLAYPELRAIALRLTDSYFLQCAPSNGPKQFLSAWGGKVQLSGIGMYSPGGSPLVHFATLWNNAAVDMYGFDDLSGNISGLICGRD